MDNIPTGRAGRGEAWKVYQKHKGQIPGERPMISSPIPIASGPLGEKAVINSLQPPRKLEFFKSRSHHVFSSFAQSLSRASLSRSNNRAQNASTSSSANPTPVLKTSRISLSRFGKKSLEPMPEKKREEHDKKEQQTAEQVLQDHPLPRPSPVPENLQLVGRAMPPQYWTGRFMALHDQFQSETLDPRNLNTVIEAQVACSTLCNNTKQSPTHVAQVQNNPSTSVYATKRLPRLSLGNHTPASHSEQGGNMSARRPSRIPHSLTSNSIFEPPRKPSPGSRDASSPAASCLYGPCSPAPSRLPSYERAFATEPSLVPAPLRLLNRREKPDGSVRKASKQKKRSPEKDIERALLFARAEILTDDESHCRRAIVHLESLCVTGEALRSFHS